MSTLSCFICAVVLPAAWRGAGGRRRDLAQECRGTHSRPVVLALWLSTRAAVVACDLAEVLGATLVLNVLSHVPRGWGVVTALQSIGRA